MRQINKKQVYIELEPDLEACVETQARRQYNQILRQLLEKGGEAELVEKLEMLRLFLESADFNKLRSESEKHLIKGEKVKFVLHLEEGKPQYQMQILEVV